MRDIRTAAVLVTAMAATLPSARALATADIQPIHSFEDIPPLAKDTAEVRRRFGDVTVMPGKTIKGDTSAQPLFQRIAEWTQSLMQQAMQGMNAQSAAAGMTAASGQALQAIAMATPKLNADQQQALREFGAAKSTVDDQYSKELERITGTYNKRLADGGCLDPGKRTVDCGAVRKEQDSATLKAGDTYLAGLAGPYTTFKTRMKSVAAEAQNTIDQADKSFAGSVPAFVRPMYQSVITVGVSVLGMVLSAESDAVAHVHERSIAPTESR